MASLVANLDIDPAFRTAIKLLHSPSPDSAEKIRNALDEIIKQRHGSAKMLVNTLNKKVIAEESTVPGTRVRSKSIETKQTITTGSGIAVAASDLDAQMGEIITGPQGIVVEVPDEMETDDNEPAIEDDQFKEFENLMCIVCHQVDVSVRNPLVECIECQSLYHQDCHKPTISEADANGATWICTMCKSTKIVASTPLISSPVHTATPPSTPSSSSSTNPTKSSSHSSGYQSKSSSSSSSKNYESSSSDKKSKSSSSSRSSPSTSSSKERSSSSKNADRSSSSGSNSKQQSERESQSGNGTNLDRQTSSGSSSSSSSGNGGGGSSLSKSVTPSINIISADKRLQIMKKKAAKMHETKRSKHK